MTTYTETLEWPIYVIINGEEIERMYQVECNIIPPTPTVIRADPDDSYEGDPGEVEISGIWPKGMKRIKENEITYHEWDALGFTDSEIEKIKDAAVEKCGDRADDYDERD